MESVCKLRGPQALALGHVLESYLTATTTSELLETVYSALGLSHGFAGTWSPIDVKLLAPKVVVRSLLYDLRAQVLKDDISIMIAVVYIATNQEFSNLCRIVNLSKPTVIPGVGLVR